MRRIIHALLLALVVAGFAADTASATPTDKTAARVDPPLDLELREAEVTNIFKLLAEVGHRQLKLDPCVHGKIDLKLKNVPLSMIIEALALKLDLRVETHDDTLVVGCRDNAAATEPDQRMERRVALEVRDVSAESALHALAGAAGFEDVDYRGDKSKRVTIAIANVRVKTVIDAIGEETGLHITVDKNRLIASP